MLCCDANTRNITSQKTEENTEMWSYNSHNISWWWAFVERDRGEMQGCVQTITVFFLEKPILPCSHRCLGTNFSETLAELSHHLRWLLWLLPLPKGLLRYLGSILCSICSIALASSLTLLLCSTLESNCRSLKLVSELGVEGRLWFSSSSAMSPFVSPFKINQVIFSLNL